MADGQRFSFGLVGIGGRAWITMSIIYTDVPGRQLSYLLYGAGKI